MQGYYRGARAATKLGELEQAADICRAGLAVDPGAKELQQMQAEAERQLRAAAGARQREAARAMAERAPARKLAAALVQRGYKVGRPQMSVGAPALLACPSCHHPVSSSNILETSGVCCAIP